MNKCVHLSKLNYFRVTEFISKEKGLWTYSWYDTLSHSIFDASPCHIVLQFILK